MLCEVPDSPSRRNVRQSISPHGLDNVLNRCCNLHSLHLRPPIRAWDIYSNGCHIPQSLDSGSLQQIRELKFTGHLNTVNDRDPAPIRLMSDILTALPALECLFVKHFGFKLTIRSKLYFGSLISTLMHLQELHLHNIKCQDGTWNLPGLLQGLKVLHVELCPSIERQNLQVLFNSPASHQLCELRLSSRYADLPRDTFDVEELVNLPALVRLSLEDEWSCELLPSFRECHEIKSITLTARLHQWSSIGELICANTWKHLICLKVSSSDETIHDPEAHSALERMEQFCDSSLIQFLCEGN